MWRRKGLEHFHLSRTLLATTTHKQLGINYCVQDAFGGLGSFFLEQSPLGRLLLQTLPTVS